MHERSTRPNQRVRLPRVRKEAGAAACSSTAEKRERMTEIIKPAGVKMSARRFLSAKNDGACTHLARVRREEVGSVRGAPSGWPRLRPQQSAPRNAQAQKLVLECLRLATLFRNLAFAVSSGWIRWPGLARFTLRFVFFSRFYFDGVLFWFFFFEPQLCPVLFDALRDQVFVPFFCVFRRLERRTALNRGSLRLSSWRLSACSVLPQIAAVRALCSAPILFLVLPPFLFFF